MDTEQLGEWVKVWVLVGNFLHSEKRRAEFTQKLWAEEWRSGSSAWHGNMNQTFRDEARELVTVVVNIGEEEKILHSLSTRG